MDYMISLVGPFKNYPQITVYHPNSDNGHAFANVGWTGWIGSITGKPHPPFHHVHTVSAFFFDLFAEGISSVKMAISEIGVSFPDSSFGHESRFGIPFTVCFSNYKIALVSECLNQLSPHSTSFETFCSLTRVCTMQRGGSLRPTELATSFLE